MSTESMMLSNHLVLSPSFSLYLQSFSASGSFQISGLFTSGGQNIGCFSISPSNKYSGLIYFRTNLFIVQGALKSLLQHNSKASILWRLAFFMVQLSHLYVTTGKTIALTIWTSTGKVISLLLKTRLGLS